jgi:hypothetical protein
MSGSDRWDAPIRVVNGKRAKYPRYPESNYWEAEAFDKGAILIVSVRRPSNDEINRARSMNPMGTAEDMEFQLSFAMAEKLRHAVDAVKKERGITDEGAVTFFSDDDYFYNRRPITEITMKVQLDPRYFGRDAVSDLLVKLLQ